MSADKFNMNLNPLGDREVEKAKNELRETPEVVSKELANLKQLIKGEKDLVWNDSDEFLTIFLRACHWYSESALKLIKSVCDFRAKHMDILSSLDVRQEEGNFMSDALNVLTERDQEGRRVLILQCGGAWNPDKMDTNKIFKLLYMIHLASIYEPITQVNGVVVIMDHKDMGMKQVKAYSPSYAKTLLTFIQHALPMRLKAIHIVYEPVIFNIAFQLFKPFIESKLKARMYFHGSKMKTLHEHISPNCLPEDYGGTLPKINYGGKEWFPALLQVENRVKEWETYGYKK